MPDPLDSTYITPLSDGEKGTIDFTQNPNLSTTRLQWNKEIEKHSAKLQSQNKPFCHHCAVSMYEKRRAEHQNMLITKINPTSKDLNPKFNDIDLSQFAKTMEVVGEQTVKREGKYGHLHYGTFTNYRCKTCGSGQSIDTTPQGDALQSPRTRK